MDSFGEPISSPQPKQYAASHGMCRVCGSLWLEQALRNTDEQAARKKDVVVSQTSEEEI